MSLVIGARIADFERFATRWRRVRAKTAPLPVFEDLLMRYGDPLRGHHNYEHVAECQTWVDQLGGLFKNRDAVSVAFDHHDAIYDPRRQDNELQSAELMSLSYLLVKKTARDLGAL